MCRYVCVCVREWGKGSQRLVCIGLGHPCLLVRMPTSLAALSACHPYAVPLCASDPCPASTITPAPTPSGAGQVLQRPPHQTHATAPAARLATGACTEGAGDGEGCVCATCAIAGASDGTRGHDGGLPCSSDAATRLIAAAASAGPGAAAADAAASSLMGSAGGAAAAAAGAGGGAATTPLAAPAIASLALPSTTPDAPPLPLAPPLAPALPAAPAATLAPMLNPVPSGWLLPQPPSTPCGCWLLRAALGVPLPLPFLLPPLLPLPLPLPQTAAKAAAPRRLWEAMPPRLEGASCAPRPNRLELPRACRLPGACWSELPAMLW